MTIGEKTSRVKGFDVARGATAGYDAPMEETSAGVLHVRSLGKSFLPGGRWAVRDLTFSCPPGRIVGLVGENGAGKTTTLRMLAGLLVPTEGDAEICGHSVRSAPALVRRSLGVLFGAAGSLYERLTGRENILYFARLNGLSNGEAERNLRDLDDLLELGNILDLRAGAFSAGMRQKAAIARSIIHDPPILLLDEPATGLDVVAARHIYAFIGRCRDLGKTVLFSSHDLTAVERLSDSVLVLHGGRLAADACPAVIAGRDSFEEGFVRLTEETP